MSALLSITAICSIQFMVYYVDKLLIQIFFTYGDSRMSLAFELCIQEWISRLFKIFDRKIRWSANRAERNYIDSTLTTIIG